MKNVDSGLNICDLDFEVLPGGSSEPVIHLPAVRVVIAVIITVWSEPANLL